MSATLTGFWTANGSNSRNSDFCWSPGSTTVYDSYGATSPTEASGEGRATYKATPRRRSTATQASCNHESATRWSMTPHGDSATRRTSFSASLSRFHRKSFMSTRATAFSPRRGCIQFGSGVRNLLYVPLFVLQRTWAENHLFERPTGLGSPIRTRGVGVSPTPRI